jgi:hypothetical protein
MYDDTALFAPNQRVGREYQRILHGSFPFIS